MRFKFAAVLIAIFATSLVSPNSKAIGAFVWDNQPGSGDSLVIHLRNFEPAVSTVVGGGVLYGVGIIDQILNQTTGQAAWASGANKEITMVFNNYAYDAVNSIPPVGPLPGVLFFTGGEITLYFDDTPDTTGYGSNASPLAGNSTNPDGTTNQDFTGDEVLMQLVGHDQELGYSLTTGLFQGAGSGLGYLDVVPGSGTLASSFDTSSIPVLDPNSPNPNNPVVLGYSDFSFRLNLDPFVGQPSDTYPIFSSDPILGAYADGTVPEPSAVLTWMGLATVSSVAYGMVSRRRQAKG